MIIVLLIVMFIMLVAIERLTSRINKLEKEIDYIRQHNINLDMEVVKEYVVGASKKKTKSCSIDGVCK